MVVRMILTPEHRGHIQTITKLIQLVINLTSLEVEIHFLQNVHVLGISCSYIVFLCGL